MQEEPNIWARPEGVFHTLLKEGDIMDYYGRSKEGRPEVEWQLLRDHLGNVAERSAAFAQSFGWQGPAHAAGLLHDAGKYSNEFQKRIREGGAIVDHSSAGGKLLVNNYPNGIGLLLAYAVLGHHNSLPDYGSLNNPTSLACRAQPPVPDHRALYCEIPLPERLASPWKIADNIGFTYFFLTRMLFSCLVDADRLDAERFTEFDKVSLRGSFPGIQELSQRMSEYMSRFTAAVHSTPVNRERAHVLNCCREAADLPQGLFTLTVPTGGGKTLSSLEFAIRHAVKHGLKRIIYIIPFTSIIEQTAQKFREVLGNNAVLEHHSNFDVTDDDQPAFSLAVENWDAPVIVTTNVQFFESLYAARATRCRKLHNIAESVLILDEAQSIPDDYLLPCLAALEELVRHYSVTAVLCTATQPALTGRWPHGSQTREIIPDAGRLYRSLKRVKVEYVGAVQDADLVEEMQREPQLLAIVNTRRHAATLYRLLGGAEGHFHLSARMYPEHRARQLANVRKRLAQGQVCRVVSTQLMEAGIDVDFPTVWRAVAGIDAIAQAAGRCNREGKLTFGRTYVFDPECGLPRGWFQRMATLGKQVLQAVDEPLAPEAVQRFFSERFMLDAGGLDRHEILKSIKQGGRRLAFPFRVIEQKFKLIEDLSCPIVIPCPDNKTLLEEIETAEFPGIYGRQLQRYTVSVHPKEFAEYLNRGWLRQLRDMYYVLDYDQGYSPELGLLTVDDAVEQLLVI